MVDVPVSKFDELSGRTVQDQGSNTDLGRFHYWLDVNTNETIKTFEVHIYDELAPIPPFTVLDDGTLKFDKI